MNGLDWFLLAVVGLGAFQGFRTGATRQLVSTVGLAFAFVLGAGLMGPVGETVVESLGTSPRTAPIVGFVVVFALVLAAAAAVGHVFRKALEAVKLGGIDATLGAVVSGLKSALGASVFLTVTAFSPLPGGNPLFIATDTREASVLHDPIRALAPEVWRLVRAVVPGIQARLADKFNTWDEGRRKLERSGESDAPSSVDEGI